MHINDFNPDRVLLFGDIHGGIGQAKRAMDLAEEAGVRVLLQLGDFGIWPGDGNRIFLDEVSRELARRDMHLFFVDGNHEDFTQLYGYPLAEDGTRPIRERLSHLPRGLRWEWGGARFGALGGAQSVDADQRVPGKTWWVEERVTADEAAAFATGGPVDVILMHDSPEGAPNSIVDDPHNFGATYFAKEMLAEAAWHRKTLASAVNPTRPRWIFHGHYHRYMTDSYRIEGSDRDTFVVGLHEGRTYRDWQFARVWDVADALL